MMEKQYKMCQSCGMPMNKDSKAGGTNADGTKNLKYCSYCYQDGDFLYKGNVKDFQEFCRQKMIEGGHNRFSAWIFTRGMSRLERWTNN
jgi:hypothetical protein